MKRFIWLLAVGCWLLAAAAQAQEWVENSPTGIASTAKDSVGFEKTSATVVEAVSGITTMTVGKPTPLANHILGFWNVPTASGFVGWNNAAGPAYIKLYGINGGTMTSAWETGLTSLSSGQTLLNSGVSTPDMVIRHNGLKSILLQTNGANTGVDIKSDQSVAFPAYGAGTLTTDASGNITATSDARLKNIIRNYEGGLDVLAGLQPIVYRWNAQSGFDMGHDYIGFTAQNVAELIPEAGGKNANGDLTISDRGVIAALVNAVNDLRRQIETPKIPIRDRAPKNPWE